MPRAAAGGKRRVEVKGGKANTSARGDRRKSHGAEDGGRNLGTGGGESRPRCPYELERERGGNLRTRGAVRVGIPWMNPRAMARVKVEMEGELNER